MNNNKKVVLESSESHAFAIEKAKDSRKHGKYVW